MSGNANMNNRFFSLSQETMKQTVKKNITYARISVCKNIRMQEYCKFFVLL